MPEGHSPLGFSGAYRWSNCEGSTSLIAAMARGPDELEDDPDYRIDGVAAHALGAYCLEHRIDAWEAFALPEFRSRLTYDMAAAVQTYIDYCQGLNGEKFIESFIHRPEFHPLAWGQLDYAATGRLSNLTIVDYKHGVGVVVEVERNWQVMGYAYLFIGEDEGYYHTDEIDLVIVQPRAEHPDGPIRKWTTTVGEIRRWAREELLPAMLRAETGRIFDLGRWCQFCPAKLVCPAMTGIEDTFAALQAGGDPLRVSDAELGRRIEQWEQLKMLGRALVAEGTRRSLAGAKVPGTKLVPAITHRVWKDGASPVLTEKLGDKAWKDRALKSPKELEGLGTEAKLLVAEWATHPIGGPTLTLASDKRQALQVKSDKKAFAAAILRL